MLGCLGVLFLIGCLLVWLFLCCIVDCSVLFLLAVGCLGVLFLIGCLLVWLFLCCIVDCSVLFLLAVFLGYWNLLLFLFLLGSLFGCFRF